MSKLDLRFDCPVCNKKRTYPSYRNWWTAQNYKRKCIECANIASIGHKLLNLNGVKTMNKLNLKKPYEWCYNMLYRKIKSGHRITFINTLTYEEFLEFTKIDKCYYCNSNIIWRPHHIKGKGNGGYHLDRKDNNLGYTKENCVVCCFVCNKMKSTMVKENFINHIQKIYNNIFK